MVLGIRAVDIEGVRIREYRRIPIGGAEQQRDHLPFGDPRAHDLGVAQGRSTRHLHRTVEAQHLIDRTGPAFRIGTQQFELVRMLMQQHRPIAAQPLDMPDQEVLTAPQRGHRSTEHRPRNPDIEQRCARVPDLEHEVAFLGGHAQDFGNDRDRQPDGEIPDQIGPITSGQTVEQFVPN